MDHESWPRWLTTVCLKHWSESDVFHIWIWLLLTFISWIPMMIFLFLHKKIIIEMLMMCKLMWIWKILWIQAETVQLTRSLVSFDGKKSELEPKVINMAERYKPMVEDISDGEE